MSNIQYKFNEIMLISRKRKIESEEDIDNYRKEKGVKWRREEQYGNENFNLKTNVLYTAEGILRVNKRMNTERSPNVNRNVGKLWVRKVYFSWDSEQFKSKFRLTKDNLSIILNKIEAWIIKTPTNLVPEPIEPNRQLGLTFYKLAHGCTFKVIGGVFGISESLTTQTFLKLVRITLQTSNLASRFTRVCSFRKVTF